MKVCVLEGQAGTPIATGADLPDGLVGVFYLGTCYPDENALIQKMEFFHNLNHPEGLSLWNYISGPDEQKNYALVCRMFISQEDKIRMQRNPIYDVDQETAQGLQALIADTFLPKIKISYNPNSGHLIVKPRLDISRN